MQTKTNRKISTRLPKSLLVSMKKDMKTKNYATYSEYIRAAIREKIKKTEVNH